MIPLGLIEPDVTYDVIDVEGNIAPALVLRPLALQENVGLYLITVFIFAMNEMPNGLN